MKPAVDETVHTPFRRASRRFGCLFVILEVEITLIKLFKTTSGLLGMVRRNQHKAANEKKRKCCSDGRTTIPGSSKQHSPKYTVGSTQMDPHSGPRLRWHNTWVFSVQTLRMILPQLPCLCSTTSRWASEAADNGNSCDKTGRSHPAAAPASRADAISAYSS